MTDLGHRARVERAVTVWVDLADGELDDMQKRFGTLMFAPRNVKLSYASTDTNAWRSGDVTVYGPQRLKSGGVSVERTLDHSFWSTEIRRGEAPEWVAALIARHMPAPVAGDDLPVQPDTPRDLDGV